jgi:sugar-specific transcriptional regulator TrmB
LGEETIKKVLMNSGLTEKEAEVYIFLARHGVHKGAEIARLLRKDKAQVFRILRRLQAKGFVEATLEFPSRFSVVPFENVIDSLLRSKQEEIVSIKEAKKDLLEFLKKKRKAEALERFLVVKGKKRIYSKISQIIKDTKQQLSVATSFHGMIQSYRFGVFEAAHNNPLRQQVQYRFLTEFSTKNLKALKALITRIPETNFDFKAINPDLGLGLFPRMVIRDNEEILLFTSRTDEAVKDEMCMWTNCKTLVQTFTTVFEDFWSKSKDLQAKISESEMGKPLKTIHAENVGRFEEKYQKTLLEAENDVIIMTSAKNLINFWESKPPLEVWKRKGLSVKILAPITKDNFEVVEQLSKYSKVRHITVSQTGTTMIDGKHLFQFKTPLRDQNNSDFDSSFIPYLYSDDLEYIDKVKVMLNDLWRDSRAPSPILLESFFPPSNSELSSHNENYVYGPDRPDSPYRKIVFPIDRKPGVLTEREVLDKMFAAEKALIKNTVKDKIVFYGKQAIAVIHPPENLNLPKMIIQVWQFNDKSSFSAEKWLMVYLQLDTPKGKAFVPVASVQDRAVDLNFREKLLSRGIAIKKIQVFDKGELQVQSNGNILFAGWTKPISLFLGKYTLPPACLLFEGYGKIKSGIIRPLFGTRFEQTWEYNGLEAFVTFFHPLSKYSGPGTDGRFARELIITQNHPPLPNIQGIE